MEAIVLDPLPVEVDTPQLLKTLRIREGSRNADEAQRLIAEAVAIARPRAIYKLAFVESRTADGVVMGGGTFTSRVLRVNLDGLNRVFAYVCTSGRELAAWVESQVDMLANYYADVINQAILRGAMGAFERNLIETYRLTQIARMNPGSLPDWPLSQQRPLFALLGDVTGAIGVTLTDSLLMTPTKTVSGIIFPTEETFASCQLCPREACPNRRAAYDAALFDRKYRGSWKLEAGSWKLEARNWTPSTIRHQLPASSIQLPASSFQQPAPSFEYPASNIQLPVSSFQPQE